MLKFIKHNLETIDNVEWYPLVSLLLFFIVFTTMLFIVIKMPKRRMEEDSQMPLNDNKEINHE
ncbi:MAG: CcoQ/FixQ family Cbb3-type cytochrome c oxidase assembly chaperone [Flavobacteriaceae bacterium]|nr:CcoQ/FixQ family Cbb3-type cytochrome c oxidase assembly chaperone [Flavobacteriaceae bacterium]